MTRRSFPPGELFVGLFALERAAIDPGQLIAAFETWLEAEGQTMGEILVERGIVDESKLAEVEKLVADRLRHRERSRVEGQESPALNDPLATATSRPTTPIFPPPSPMSRVMMTGRFRAPAAAQSGQHPQRNDFA